YEHSENVDAQPTTRVRPRRCRRCSRFGRPGCVAPQSPRSEHSRVLGTFMKFPDKFNRSALLRDKCDWPWAEARWVTLHARVGVSLGSHRRFHNEQTFRLRKIRVEIQNQQRPRKVCGPSPLFPGMNLLAGLIGPTSGDTIQACPVICRLAWTLLHQDKRSPAAVYTRSRCGSALPPKNPEAGKKFQDGTKVVQALKKNGHNP